MALAIMFWFKKSLKILKG